jgi:uncharacterized Rmd1/YagE family protein
MKNRFAGLKTVKTLQSSLEAAEPEPATETQRRGVNKQENTIQPSDDKNIETRRRGRPNGKRSNENFQQVTAYISKDTYKQTKMKLLAADEPQEFSELVDYLLVGWLRER